MSENVWLSPSIAQTKLYASVPTPEWMDQGGEITASPSPMTRCLVSVGSPMRWDTFAESGTSKGRDGRDVRTIMSNENSPTAAGRELLSGSLLTLNRAVRNMMNHTGVGIVEACKMASLNPARLLGMDREIGSLEMGKRADILAVSEEIAPQMVMLNGEVRY